jgi:hypothetical protein
MTVIKWLKKNTFKVHLIAFLLMITSSVLLYSAAERGNIPLMWLLVGLFITGNILVILVR